jgi:hypothetical protein
LTNRAGSGIFVPKEQPMQREMIEEILDSGYKAGLIITGGGTEAISQLLQYGGGSKFLLDAKIPYSTRAFTSLTGRQSDFVSLEACDQLTRRALFDAHHYGAGFDGPIIGVGCTAKLTYDGERSGRKHEAFIGIGCSKNGACAATHVRVGFPHPMNRQEQESWLAEGILACIFTFVCDNVKYQLPSHIKTEVTIFNRS